MKKYIKVKHAPVDVSRLLQPWMGGVGRPSNRFDAGGAIVQSLFALIRLSPHFERAAQTLEEASAARDVGHALAERRPDHEGAIEKLRVDIEESRKATALRHREVDTAIDLIANETSAQTELLIVCPRHGRTGGRMHIVNPRSYPVRLVRSTLWGGDAGVVCRFVGAYRFVRVYHPFVSTHRCVSTPEPGSGRGVRGSHRHRSHALSE